MVAVEPAGRLWMVGVVDELLLPPQAAASGTAATNAMASNAFHPGRWVKTLFILRKPFLFTFLSGGQFAVPNSSGTVGLRHQVHRYRCTICQSE